jgi:hypothetical protein
MGTVAYEASVAPDAQLWFEDNHSSGNWLDAWYDDVSIRGLQNPQEWAKPQAFTIVTCTSWALPPFVPFHGQYLNQAVPQLNEPCSPPGPNGRCVDACLHMVFDRWGDNLPVPGPLQVSPQEELEAAANTNDRAVCPDSSWTGTWLDDARRAAHFSHRSQALTAVRDGCPPDTACPDLSEPGAKGYTWRDLGYAVVDSVWTDIATSDTVDVASGLWPIDLEVVIGSGYPLIALIKALPGYCDSIVADSQLDGAVECPVVPEDVDGGHACVLIGYDNQGTAPGNGLGRPAFLIHDPAVCKYGWIPQQYFWDTVWETKRFLFAAPWQTRWLAPSQWHHSQKLTATLVARYTAPRLLAGLYPVTDVTATLTPTWLGLQDGETSTHDLDGIAVTGDLDFTCWALQVAPPQQGFSIEGTLAGTVAGDLVPVSSTSYASYTDEIGGAGSVTQPVTFGFLKAQDPGHHGWPYPGRWWSRGGGGGSGGAGGSGLRLVALGGSAYELFATVGNFGQDPLLPGTVYRFHWEDPSLATRAPGGTLIGEVPVPTLATGDTLTLGPVPWTAPPANGLGEPWFAIVGEIDCPGDPPASDWPQGENNHGVLSHFDLAPAPGDPVSVQVRVENPDSAARDLVLCIAREEEAEDWPVTLGLPAGTPLPFGPGESQTTTVTVTPAPGEPTGTIHVSCLLYEPGGALVRETGGITLTVDVDTTGTGVATAATAGPLLALAQSRPNPCRGTTTIHYAVPVAAEVTLRVYDVAGRRVRTLCRGPHPAGRFAATWRGRNDGGAPVAAGVYFYRLETTAGEPRTRKLVLVR